MVTKQRVLFLCTGNSCRSQMAEGWLRHLAGDRYQVFSAGTDPHGLHPRAVEAMAEVGIDISTHTSTCVKQYLDQIFDYTITVCDRARENCPVWPGGGDRLHWSLDDPAATTGTEEEIKAAFRRGRDALRAAVESFISE